MSCLHHCLEKWFLIDLFYRGLSSNQIQKLDTFGGGTIASKSPNEAWQTCENLAENSLQWDDMDSRRDRIVQTREHLVLGGVYEMGGVNPTNVTVMAEAELNLFN